MFGKIKQANECKTIQNKSTTKNKRKQIEYKTKWVENTLF